MGNRFDAYLAGRLATEPTLSTTKDGKPWAKFRLAVDDRSPNRETGEWETSQTIFHDVVAFGRLAERAVGTLHSGDAVIAQGEFRFRSYEDSGGTTRTGTQFVASRLGPDILLADFTLHGGRTAKRTSSGLTRPTASPRSRQGRRSSGLGSRQQSHRRGPPQAARRLRRRIADRRSWPDKVSSRRTDDRTAVAEHVTTRSAEHRCPCPLPQPGQRHLHA